LHLHFVASLKPHVRNFKKTHQGKKSTTIVIGTDFDPLGLSGTIIRGTLKTPNSQLVSPISIKLQRPDGCD
jgi:hypothetical protein